MVDMPDPRDMLMRSRSWEQMRPSGWFVGDVYKMFLRKHLMKIFWMTFQSQNLPPVILEQYFLLKVIEFLDFWNLFYF